MVLSWRVYCPFFWGGGGGGLWSFLRDFRVLSGPFLEGPGPFGGSRVLSWKVEGHFLESPGSFFGESGSFLLLPGSFLKSFFAWSRVLFGGSRVLRGSRVGSRVLS